MPRAARSGAVSLLVLDDRFADPTKIDSSMPCFRLGAFGTERQRHKRVNGLYSCVFVDEHDGDLLLAASLAAISGKSTLNHLAAQAPSDAPALCAWYDRHFERQGSFPILSRPLIELTTDRRSIVQRCCAQLSCQLAGSSRQSLKPSAACDYDAGGILNICVTGRISTSGRRDRHAANPRKRRDGL